VVPGAGCMLSEQRRLGHWISGVSSRRPRWQHASLRPCCQAVKVLGAESGVGVEGEGPGLTTSHSGGAWAIGLHRLSLTQRSQRWCQHACGDADVSVSWNWASDLSAECIHIPEWRLTKPHEDGRVHF